MARPPTVPEKINFVVDVLSNTCIQDPWFYIETAAEPLGDLVLVLLSFGLDDVIRGAFRPKGLASGRHGRGGRRGGKGPPGIPELGEEIGKRIPGQDDRRNRQVSQGVKSLWRLDAALQRGLFWWLVYEEVPNFLYNWATNIAAFNKCTPGSPSFQRENLSGQTIAGPTFGLALSLPTLLPFSGYGPGSQFGANTADWDSIVLLSGTFDRDLSGGLCRVRLVISDNQFTARYGASDWVLSPPGSSRGLIARAVVPKGTGFGWAIQREQISGSCNGVFRGGHVIMSALNPNN